jgi:hypothetical protein
LNQFHVQSALKDCARSPRNGQVDAIIAAVALLVDANDEGAKRFCLKYGFVSFRIDR